MAYTTYVWNISDLQHNFVITWSIVPIIFGGKMFISVLFLHMVDYTKPLASEGLAQTNSMTTLL